VSVGSSNSNSKKSVNSSAGSSSMVKPKRFGSHEFPVTIFKTGVVQVSSGGKQEDEGASGGEEVGEMYDENDADDENDGCGRKDSSS